MRNIESLQAEEWDQFYAVPAWRIWIINTFSPREYRLAFDQAATRPSAIIIHPGRPGYQRVWDRYEVNRPAKTPLVFRGPGTLDLPSFLLEPLTEEEVEKINKDGRVPGPSGSVDKLNEFFKPEDLRKILDR